ncbi:hypothetical protein PFISCL1PPCAC_24600, partial [Pristionchus fissidentatus]
KMYLLLIDIMIQCSAQLNLLADRVGTLVVTKSVEEILHDLQRVVNAIVHEERRELLANGLPVLIEISESRVLSHSLDSLEQIVASSAEGVVEHSEVGRVELDGLLGYIRLCSRCSKGECCKAHEDK